MSSDQMWSPGGIGKSLHNRTLNPERQATKVSIHGVQ
jgi:hypothetical protein